jgi:hypothetical protein
MNDKVMLQDLRHRGETLYPALPGSNPAFSNGSKMQKVTIKNGSINLLVQKICFCFHRKSVEIILLP